MKTQGRHRFRPIDKAIFLALTALIGLSAASSLAASKTTHSLEVTATAYNSLPDQGQGDPTIAAWGTKLRPGMKAIAVSRDLLDLGLTEGVKVRIDGLPDTYTVLDKTAKRWKRRIDIYMGADVNAAKQWGKRKVTIRW
jgi:3D (Asp-Asp-Asp) domain-containing protein